MREATRALDTILSVILMGKTEKEMLWVMKEEGLEVDGKNGGYVLINPRSHRCRLELP
jgi:hypothetical protein